MEVQGVVQTLLDGSILESKILQLIQLCESQESNAVKFGRCGGFEQLNRILTDKDSSAAAATVNESLLKKILHLFEFLFSFKNVCLEFINWDEGNSMDAKLFNFSLLVDVITKYRGDLPILALRIFVSVLKCLPLASNPNINIEDISQNILFLSESRIALMLRPLVGGVLHEEFNVKKLSFDILSSFVGDLEDHVTILPETDVRMENLLERKTRVLKLNLIKQRSKRVAECFFKLNHTEVFLSLSMSSKSNIEKQCAQICLGKIIQPIDSEAVKEFVKEYVIHGSSHCDNWEQVVDFENSFIFTKPDVSIWAIQLNGGVDHIVQQFSNVEGIGSSISADLLCNLTHSEDGFALVAPLIESGLFSVIMDSKSSHLKATAAAAISKYLVKSKGDKAMVREESLKLFQAVIDIIASYEMQTSESATPASQLPSFSKVETVFKASGGNKLLNQSDSDFKFDLGAQRLSFEKAIEVLASLIIQDSIKQILTSSNAKISAALKKLFSISKDIDVQSTAAFGLAFILANLTVTNKELQRRALTQSDMSEEQYEQLKKLEEVHGSKSESKTKENQSTDTQELCDARIGKIVQAGAIPGLLRLINSGSPQTKEQCARALGQICIVVSIRGLVIQHGALKLLSGLSLDEKNSKSTRIKTAHCIAKLLVTTNPNIIDDQIRLSCISPLIFLLREVESSNLQQFEALLSVTNLISCGEAEVNLFVHLKGIPAAHYLMFSDHLMVRRAATEVFCNMSTNEEFLKLIRHPEKLKIWIKFSTPATDSLDASSDAIFPDVESDEFSTIRAATGTLAMASGDPEVCRKLILSEDLGLALSILMKSPHEELVHRSLVIVGTMIDGSDSKDCLAYVKRMDILQIITSIAKSKSSSLATIAKEILTLVK